MHQDVIMECLDDPDISIRLQALDLIMGMVDSDNLIAVVERLMRQLKSAPISTLTADEGQSNALGVEPAADYDGEDPEEILKPAADHSHGTTALPAEYRISTIRRIIDMCSKDTYANIVEFEWYVDILIQLIKLMPIPNATPGELQASNEDLDDGQISGKFDIASIIGWELRNVAVRVSTVRADVVTASFSLMATHASDSRLTSFGIGEGAVLACAAWVLGEYIDTTEPPNATLEPLIHPKAQSLPPSVISAYLQAIPKVLAFLVSRTSDWNPERQTMMSLLVARVIHFLEPLATHPSIEVQERSVELLELMKVASQAIVNHDLENRSGPLLLTKALPQLFSAFDLNPVAPSAQRKVPLPTELDLEIPINKDLAALLQRAEQDSSSDTYGVEFESFYNQRPPQREANGPALDIVSTLDPGASSYQNTESRSVDSDTPLRKRVQRRERSKDDPFYIGNDDNSSGTSTPFHDILRTSNGDDVDVDSIPIIDLDIGGRGAISDGSNKNSWKAKRKRPKRVHIAKDESIENETDGGEGHQKGQEAMGEDSSIRHQLHYKPKKSLLEVDSSGLGSFPLGGKTTTSDLLEVEKPEAQDEEMAKALAEVERLRLEMQRTSERVQATDGTPPEGTLVKKKKKKKVKLLGSGISEKEVWPSAIDPAQASQDVGAIPVVKKKKKKKKKAPGIT